MCVSCCVQFAHAKSHVCDQYVFFQTHLSNVLSCVRFLSAILLHSLKILQLLAVRVPEIVVHRLEETFCIMEESMVSVLSVCVCVCVRSVCVCVFVCVCVYICSV
jgi:hypothetical protein